MIKPMGNRILVQINKKSEKTSTGIFIPDTAGSQSSVKLATVVAPEHYGDSILKNDGIIYELSKGDQIYVDVKDGITIIEDGEEYKLYLFENILAKSEK